MHRKRSILNEIQFNLKTKNFKKINNENKIKNQTKNKLNKQQTKQNQTKQQTNKQKGAPDEYKAGWNREHSQRACINDALRGKNRFYI